MHDFFAGTSVDCCAHDLDLTLRAVTTVSSDGTKLVNHIHAVRDTAEDGVLAVQVRCGCQGDEESALVLVRGLF